MRKWIYLLASLLIVSCQHRLGGVVPPSGGDAVKLKLNFGLSEQTVVTRTTDENALRDLNIWLVKENGQSYHTYTKSIVLYLDVEPGAYTAYVLANLHENAGDKSADELAAFALPAYGFGDDLPMSARCGLSVYPASPGDVYVAPTIELMRNVARIDYSVKVDTPEPIELLSLRFYNLPDSSRPFAADRESTAGEFRESTEIDLAGLSAYSGRLYMGENLQGVVSEITEQRDKNPANAPLNATYMLIRGKSGEKILNYHVYLGENSTSDFNVRRNTAHTMNITILGENTVDTRISAYAVSITTDERLCPGY